MEKNDSPQDDPTSAALPGAPEIDTRHKPKIEPAAALEADSETEQVPEPQPAVPQLIRSTKSTLTTPTSPAEETDDTDDAWPQVSDEDEPAEPAPRSYTPPLRDETVDDPYAEPDKLNEYVEDPGDPDGVHAEDQRRKKQAAQPPAAAPAKRKKGHPFRTSFIVLLIVAAGAYGAFWFGNYQAGKNDPPAPKQHTAATPKATTPKTVPTTHYDSANFSVGLDYPQTWKLSDNTSKLVVTSPDTPLTTASGGKTTGHIVLTVQHQQTAIAGYPAGGAVAVLESQKLTYSQPTPEQRAQTYLSFLSYSQNDGLDALYITGDDGYTQGQAVPQSDVVQSDPLIAVGFETCASDDCTSGTLTPLTLMASSWQTAVFNKQVTSLLESIQLEG